MGDGIVKFWVGPDHRLFNVHAGLLKHRSSMQSIFDGTSTTDNRLVNAEDGGFILTNENAEAFAILVNYLYRPVTTKILSAETVQLAIPLYLIAELMEMSSLMNCVIDEIRYYDLQGLLPQISVEEVVEVYERSKDGSKIWEYLVMGIVCKTIKGEVDQEWGDSFAEMLYFNPEIGVDYFQASIKYGYDIKRDADYRRPLEGTAFSHCAFHVHEKGEMDFCRAIRRARTVIDLEPEVKMEVEE